MKRFTKRCDFNDILNCQNLIDGAEEDCEYRSERGYCANPRLYFSGKELDNFEEKFGLKGSVISAVDLIKGIAKCAGMNSIDVEGATGNCDTNWEGKAQAALDAILNGSDFVYVHMEAPDEMGHQGAPEKKKFAVETIDKKVVKFLKDELEKRGIDYRMMILPDHPTPIKLKTHVSDPVPYIIYDSTNETDKNANLTYTEENGKKTGIYIEEGYTLMNRFLGK